jgi:hypothetical protein
MLPLELNRTYTFYAYHGTDEESAIDITANGLKIFEDLRDDHWLGNGIYFFREDAQQALTWAINKVRSVKALRGKKACVIEVEINLQEKNFLNLDSRDGMLALKKFISQLNSTIKHSKIGLAFKEKDEAQQRHFVFSLLPVDEYYVIQRTFKTDSALNENSNIKRLGLYLNGVQVCVRNLSAIKGKSNVVADVVVDNFVTKKKSGKPRTWS